MTENKLRDYEKSMVTWCKSLQGKYKLMKRLNKKALITQSNQRKALTNRILMVFHIAVDYKKRSI